MSTTRRLWLGLAALLIVGFSTLLWMGGEIYRQAPPMPVALATAPCGKTSETVVNRFADHP